MENFIASLIGLSISVFGLAIGWTLGAFFDDKAGQHLKCGVIVLLINGVASVVLILAWQIIQR